MEIVARLLKSLRGLFAKKTASETVPGTVDGKVENIKSVEEFKKVVNEYACFDRKVK